MKTKLFLLVCLLCISSYGFAQDNEEDFETYITNANTDVSNCFKDKDYSCVITKLKGIETRYNLLSDKEKGDYSGILQHIYYNLACAYAMSDETENAVDAFRKAIDTGYVNYIHAKQDTDLNSIADNKEFKELLASIREKGDYIHILKKAGPYSKLPEFTYEEASSPDLIKIRKYFNLDSIAGNGADVSKILNLMTWLHNTVRHNGGHMPTVERRSAIDLYEYDQKHKKGMNCRALAIFLNECYLAMGIKSRYMTCLPKDEDDSDCHVINSVYAESLGKWIWVDPSFNAYVKDDKGNMLGISEVRERILSDLPVFINEDANWNNESPYTKEMYIDGYMAKNLYWFQCTVESKCNADLKIEYNTFV